MYTADQLRHRALDFQQLISGRYSGKKGTLEAIRHLGYVQLDTLSVVVRAHHHTLWSRVENYKETYPDELMREKKIFEYWSHAAAYLPMEDYRFSLLRKQEFLDGKKHWFAKDRKYHQYVLERIKAEGAMQSRDFETDRTRGSWFDWKPAKIALEQLFQDGSLMIKERKGFQKVYDLTERILPTGIDTTIPSQQEYAQYLIRTNLRAHGIASLKDFTHLRKGMRSPVEKKLKKMLREGEIVKVRIPHVSDEYYSVPGIVNYTSAIVNRRVGILSPFDNAVIRRERLLHLFDYDFAIECYLPEHKRKYGYFCLPVLWKNEFVARFDPKADRESKTFHVRKFHLEKKMSKKEKVEFMEEFEKALMRFAEFNGCPLVDFDASR